MSVNHFVAESKFVFFISQLLNISIEDEIMVNDIENTLREIIDIKHGGIERFGIEVHYLGTSVPVEKLVDAAVELKADAILASTIISHDNIHYKNMKRIHELAVEKGIRDQIIIAAGGTQVIPEEAVKTGVDAGFGRNSHGIDVATFLVEKRREMREAK